jgi:hypothetical protein
MNFAVSTYIISGVSLGVEYVRGDEEHSRTVVIDLFLVRVMIHF